MLQAKSVTLGRFSRCDLARLPCRRPTGKAKSHDRLGKEKFMSRADLPSPTPDPCLAPTLSAVQAAHTGLIERLLASKPHRILYIADARDLEERAEHLQQVLGAVLDYVGTIVADTDHVAPGGSIDRKYLLGLISDVAGDVAGSISNAAEDLAAGRV
jgi:hypothetical protein